MPAPWPVRRLTAVDESQIEQLAAILIDCVEGGASVSFMHPLTRERALAFWHRVAAGVAAGERALLVAEQIGGVALMIDAKNARAAAWYASFGAVALDDAPLTLLLPLKTIEVALSTK